MGQAKYFLSSIQGLNHYSQAEPELTTFYLIAQGFKIVLETTRLLQHQMSFLTYLKAY